MSGLTPKAGVCCKMVGSVGQASSWSELEQHVEQLICSVGGVVPLSHDIHDVVAERQAERWLCVEYKMPRLSCSDTDASQYELMPQACHLWNAWRISGTFHRCTTDSLQVGTR